MIAIGKYFIYAKETEMCIIKTLLKPLRVPWTNKIYRPTEYGKRFAIGIISHNFFWTCSEPTDTISKGNRVIYRVIFCIYNCSS